MSFLKVLNIAFDTQNHRDPVTAKYYDLYDIGERFCTCGRLVTHLYFSFRFRQSIRCHMLRSVSSLSFPLSSETAERTYRSAIL